MIVKILRTTAVQGEVLTPGELVDVPDADAKALIAYGKAEASEAPAEPIETQDPEPENRDRKARR